MRPHPSPSPELEIEIKLKLNRIEDIRPKIVALGFTVAVPYSFESNTVFDTPDRTLKNRGSLLRLRTMNGNHTLTFKCPPPEEIPDAVGYKIKKEINVGIADSENFQAILTALGFEPFFIYEKYREILKREADSLIVTLDHTPVGDYLEIEGQTDPIDRLAGQLGFGKPDYITDTYYTLFVKQGKTGDMTF
ncbi:MAG: class IV adenylate cyclase [Candidatus Omnitrophota bacterium]